MVLKSWIGEQIILLIVCWCIHIKSTTIYIKHWRSLYSSTCFNVGLRYLLCISFIFFHLLLPIINLCIYFLVGVSISRVYPIKPMKFSVIRLIWFVLFEFGVWICKDRSFVHLYIHVICREKKKSSIRRIYDRLRKKKKNIWSVILKNSFITKIALEMPILP